MGQIRIRKQYILICVVLIFIIFYNSLNGKFNSTLLMKKDQEEKLNERILALQNKINLLENEFVSNEKTFLKVLCNVCIEKLT